MQYRPRVTSHVDTSVQKSGLNTDSSPFQSSPLESASSPRLFWQNRNSENLNSGAFSGSPSPTRRSSIERLQKASRVKNSNILALEQKQEYDPARIPQIERPLSKVQGNSFRSSYSSGLRSLDSSDRTSVDFDQSGSLASLSVMSPKLGLDAASTSRTPSKDQASPTKSSMSPSKLKGSFDHDTSDLTGDCSIDERQLPNGHSLHRHAKSVTFDAAPPQVNEYETATPDLSSIGTNSREGSYDSIGDDEEEELLYDPANIETHEDSFDASLEDTDKTPVVGPDDWRGESPAGYGEQLDRWDGSPMPEATPSALDVGQSSEQRSNSTNSNGEHRPLPPLPGGGHSRRQSTGGEPPSPGMSATAERLLGAHRSLPSPPPAFATKTDIQNIGNGRMTLEERLKLMMSSDDAGKTAAELQRERRLRRANGRDQAGSPGPEAEGNSSLQEALEGDDTIGDISALDDYQLPAKISRESIMRRVNGNKDLERESDYNFSSPAPSSSPQRSPVRSPDRQTPLDPDVPIPSTEEPALGDIDEEEEEGSVIVNRYAGQHYEDDEVYDMDQHSDLDGPEDASHLYDEDDGSHYSDQNDPSTRGAEQTQKTEPEGVVTPRPATPTQTVGGGDEAPALEFRTGKQTLSHDLEPFVLPRPEESHQTKDEVEPRALRPSTPDQSRSPMSKPEYDGSGWGEPEEYDDDPGSPGSVIHHPASDEEVFEDDAPKEPKESPTIPERIATVKASGSKLKTRLSNTPSDLAAMREARRQVSHEIPAVPPIPQKHRDRLSRDAVQETEAENDDGHIERHPSFKKRSLKLDLDLGLSLDQDFERVIETQKVNMNAPSLPLVPHVQGTNVSAPSGSLQPQNHVANTKSPI